MTFAVVQVENGHDKVVGTIWANAEAEAQTIFCDLLNSASHQEVVLRRAEERELPMKLFS